MIDRKRRASWRPVSEAELRAHAQAGGSWPDFSQARGIPVAMLRAAASVLGVSNVTERARIRRAVIESMHDGVGRTVESLRSVTGGTLVCMRHALDDLREDGLIKPVVRKVNVDDPRKAWAQYVITPAGLAELAKTQRDMQ